MFSRRTLLLQSWSLLHAALRVFQLRRSLEKLAVRKMILRVARAAIPTLRKRPDLSNAPVQAALAVAIGTAHGVYSGVPKLDSERLSAICNIVDIPLVLHGASGLSDDAVQECIRRGICKVNFATELRIAFSDGVKSVLEQTPQVFDPKKYPAAGRESVKKLVKGRMEVCGCVGQIQLNLNKTDGGAMLC